MPDRRVKTIRDLIHYQYSKIIAKRAFETEDGIDAKMSHYGFRSDAQVKPIPE